MMFIAIVIGWGGELSGKTVILETGSETVGHVQPKSQCFFLHPGGGSGLATVLAAVDEESVSYYHQVSDKQSEDLPILRALSVA